MIVIRWDSGVHAWLCAMVVSFLVGDVNKALLQSLYCVPREGEGLWGDWFVGGLTESLFSAYDDLMAYRDMTPEYAREMQSLRKRKAPGSGRPRKASSCTCGAVFGSRRELQAHCVGKPDHKLVPVSPSL